MSRTAQLLVTLALAAVFAVSAVSAIQCWSCVPTGEGETRKDCSQEAHREPKNCSAEYTYCRKMIQNVQGTVSYVMQCAKAEGGMKKLYYNTANDYVKANVYHCNTTLCNSAVGVGASKLAAVPVLALAWMLH